MTDNYEYYETYDPEAKGEINLEEHIRDWLWTMELMFEFVGMNEPEILDDFLTKVKTSYTNELENTSFVLSEVGFDRISDDQSILGSHHKIKDLGLQVIMKYIPLEEGYTLTQDKVQIRYVDYLRAKHMLLYHRIVALVETLGREDGIEIFKAFVQFWGKEAAKKQVRTVTLREARKSFVEFWEKSNAFEFGVVDIDDDMFLAKFDKCVWYESMNHVEDQELAYYTVCYPGPRIGRHVNQNIWMRRSVTLFTGDFCDELRWDRHVHDEPEQPAHEFSRNIVAK
ncbi:MAG: L-2-amino-thiazoline-4-carboxylic acid hydrolase [Candidatus Thorarchaeota archaeon]|nr:MAG: L-2-amino-thiazoline-4-carboxylic acid hydrolase [Candidatus Thorarchaeota archaeon]